MKLARKLLIVSNSLLLTGAFAQVPDTVSSFDAGGRALGMGGSINANVSDSTAALNNPAALGHARTKSVSMAIRNLPRNDSTWTNQFNNPTVSTKSNTGPWGFTHFGYVLPLKKGENQSGTLGLSYSVGGYLREVRTGTGDLVVDAITSIRNYNELIKAKTDFYTIGYGWSTPSGNLSYGASFVMATQFIRNRQTYDVVTNGNPVTNPPLDLSGQGVGIGGVVGLQIIPSSNPNMSIGLSLRSPINFSGNGSTKAYYDEVPGKASASFAYRQDGYRGGNDYMIFGLQADAFFHNNRAQAIQRKRVVNIGAGVEYNHLRGNARIPIRLGFSAIPAAGAGFKERNALTFGFGYRPLSSPLSVDFNFAATGGTGFDGAIMFNYRMK